MIWLLLPVTAACMAILAHHVAHLADGLIRWADIDQTGPPTSGSEPDRPLDDLPPDTVDWDDLTLRLELWALTEKELA